MIPYPRINPEIVHIGPLALRWYGLMYALGFASSYLLVRRQLKKGTASAATNGKQAKQAKQETPSLSEAFLDSLYTWLVVGLVLGARLGYVLFYDLSTYLHDPFEVVRVWHGGMSFHGGMIGTLAAGVYLLKFEYANRSATRKLVVE